MDKVKNIKSNISNKLTRSKVEMLVGVPLITQIGNKKIIIENYKSIVGFLEYEVKINTTIGLLKIFGRNMTIIEMTSETLIIQGEISKIEML